MGPLGWQETVFIFVLALLFFGPKKLPELGKQLAKGLAEFRRASNELKATFDREMSNLEREAEGLKEATQQVHNELTSHDSSYESSYYDYETNYGHGPDESTASNHSSTVGASATQGAESTTYGAPEGTMPATSPAAVASSEAAAGSVAEAAHEAPASSPVANGSHTSNGNSGDKPVPA